MRLAISSRHSGPRTGPALLLCAAVVILAAGCSGPEPLQQAGSLDLMPLARCGADVGGAPASILLSTGRGSALLGPGWVDGPEGGQVNAERHAKLHLPLCPDGAGTVQVRLRLRDPGINAGDGKTGVIITFNGRKLERMTLGDRWSDHQLDLDVDRFRRGTNELQFTGRPGSIALSGVELQLPGPGAWFTADRTTRRAVVSAEPLELDLPHPLPVGALLDVSVAGNPHLLPPGHRPGFSRLEWCRLTDGPGGTPVPDGEWTLLLEERAMPVEPAGAGDGFRGGWYDHLLPLDLPPDAPLRLRMRTVGRNGEDGTGVLQAWGPLTLSWPAATGEAGAIEPAGPNLILILADTLRADRLGAGGSAERLTPALDALARESVHFSDTVSQAPSTMPSVTSFFTGRYFTQVADWVDRRSLPGSVPMLAEAMSGQGRTLAVVTNPLLMPEFGFARGFDEYYHLRGRPRSFHGRAELPVHQPAEVVNARFLERLPSLSRGRFFAFLHYMDPHDPYLVEDGEGGAHRFSGGRLAGRPWEGWLGPAIEEITGHGDSSIVPRDREMVVRAYDNGVRHFDRELGLLLAELRARGLLENTVVAVVADHGEEFFEHGLVGHGHSVYGELLQVPALVRFPHRPGFPSPALVRQPVELLDVAATLIDAMGAAPPEGHLGDSLMPMLLGDDGDGLSRERFFETRRRDWVMPPLDGHLSGIEHEGWKLVRNRQTSAEQLFHLRSDPGEFDDVAAANRERAAELSRRLSQWLADQRPPGSQEDKPLSGQGVEDREIEALKALGYMQ